MRHPNLIWRATHERRTFNSSINLSQDVRKQLENPSRAIPAEIVASPRSYPFCNIQSTVVRTPSFRVYGAAPVKSQVADMS